MAYLALADLKTYLGTTSTADDTELQAAIDDAVAEIENYVGNTFEGTTGARYYRSNDLLTLPRSDEGYSPYSLGLGSFGLGVGLDGGRTYYSNIYSRRVLYLRKPLLALGGLTNGDETTIASTDCWLEPRNEPPYEYIRLKSAESWSFGTDGEITVSGTWGLSTSAAGDIVRATKEMAAYLLQVRHAPTFDVVADPASGTITVPKGIPAHVKRILEDAGYVRTIRFA